MMLFLEFHIGYELLFDLYPEVKDYTLFDKIDVRLRQRGKAYGRIV